MVGILVGIHVGRRVGILVGLLMGDLVGMFVGLVVGLGVGLILYLDTFGPCSLIRRKLSFVASPKIRPSLNFNVDDE